VPKTAERRSDGARTHAAILDAAMRLASVEGINGLTIGRLAADLGVSKSGLYAHFGSKQELQRETIEAAREVIEREVTKPGMAASPGLDRLQATTDAFFSYVERRVFPGGCFFANLLAEVDAQPGPLQLEIRADYEGWRGFLVEILDDAAAPSPSSWRSKSTPPSSTPTSCTSSAGTPSSSSAAVWRSAISSPASAVAETGKPVTGPTDGSVPSLPEPWPEGVSPC
jgi:AcrR family transcriptional regulator